MGDARPQRARLAEALAVVMGGYVDDLRRHVGQTPDITWSRSISVDVGAMATFLYDDDGVLSVHQWTITSPREAWEAMATAGLISHGDVDEPRRRFESIGLVEGTIVSTIPLRADPPGTSIARVLAARPEDVGAPIEIGMRALYEGRVPLPHPTTVADCVALASDWPGVLAAEAAAREVVRVERIAWRVGEVTRGSLRIDQTFLGVARRQPISRDMFERVESLGYGVPGVGDAIMLVCPAL